MNNELPILVEFVFCCLQRSALIVVSQTICYGFDSKNDFKTKIRSLYYV